MAVEEGLDTGGVYARVEVPIGPATTLDELRDELVEVGTRLLVDTLDAGLGEPEPQHGEVTYAAKIDPAELRIDWSRPPAEIDRLVRLGGGVDDVPGCASEDQRRPTRRWCTCPDRGPAGGQAADVVRGVAQRCPAVRRGMVRVTSSRQLAYQVLRRVESDGAYANLTLAAALDRSRLSDADRRFVTDLVYGTTRMRRACDALVDRFVSTPPDPATRTLLRLGAYQLAFAGVPAHAAVGETVALAPNRTRGFVNAVLRKVSTTAMVWPSEWARLSYPDWIAETVVAELGETDAHNALERMNAPATVTTRADGYVQDLSSQWVAAAVEAQPGELVFDACAAPGGKATALATAGAHVIAGDTRARRAGLVAANVARLEVPTWRRSSPTPRILRSPTVSSTPC